MIVDDVFQLATSDESKHSCYRGFDGFEDGIFLFPIDLVRWMDQKTTASASAGKKYDDTDEPDPVMAPPHVHRTSVLLHIRVIYLKGARNLESGGDRADDLGFTTMQHAKNIRERDDRPFVRLG